MDVLSRSHLHDLAERRGDPCVSFYIPTYRVESELSQNHIHFKNALKQAAEQLAAQGHRKDDIDELLEPARARIDDEQFWRYQGDGLATFLADGDIEFVRMPVPVTEELVVVGTRFHLKPLFPLIATNNRFYLLALSQNEVKLYQGTHHALTEMQATEVPKSLREALPFDDYEETVQAVTANRVGSGAMGRQDAQVHGQGVTEDDKPARPKDELHRFFREVNEGVEETLEGETAPLLLAGVKYYLPIYREQNGYQHLIEDELVAGNPEFLNPKTLHAKAWEVLEPRFLEQQKEDLGLYHQTDGQRTDLTSDDLSEIVPASRFARIRTAFASIGHHVWGTYDPEANTVAIHDEQQPGDDDLTDLVAVETFLHGGTVHALRPENMPIEGRALAAMFRFPADVKAEQQ